MSSSIMPSNDLLSVAMTSHPGQFGTAWWGLAVDITPAASRGPAIRPRGAITPRPPRGDSPRRHRRQHPVQAPVRLAVTVVRDLEVERGDVGTGVVERRVSQVEGVGDA